MEIEGDSERDISSPIRTVNRAHRRETTVTAAVAAPRTSDANSNRVVRIRSN